MQTFSSRSRHHSTNDGHSNAVKIITTIHWTMINEITERCRIRHWLNFIAIWFRHHKSTGFQSQSRLLRRLTSDLSLDSPRTPTTYRQSQSRCPDSDPHQPSHSQHRPSSLENSCWARISNTNCNDQAPSPRTHISATSTQPNHTDNLFPTSVSPPQKITRCVGSVSAATTAQGGTHHHKQRMPFHRAGQPRPLGNSISQVVHWSSLVSGADLFNTTSCMEMTFGEAERREGEPERKRSRANENK